MPALKYLSPEWTLEAQQRLRSQLTPETMKNLTSSMLTVYHNCPDGQDRALYYKIENGIFTDISVRQEVTKHINVYLNFVNVSNNPDESYQYDPEKNSKIEYYGTTIDFGIQYAF